MVASYFYEHDEDRAQEAMALQSPLTESTPWASNLLGILEYDAEKHHAAIEWYRRAIEQDDTIRKSRFVLVRPRRFAFPHNGLGNSLDALGQHGTTSATVSSPGLYEEAVEAYREAIRLGPEDAFPRNGLGNSLGALGRHEEAVEAYREAIRLGPEDAFPRTASAIASAPWVGTRRRWRPTARRSG